MPHHTTSRCIILHYIPSHYIMLHHTTLIPPILLILPVATPTATARQLPTLSSPAFLASFPRQLSSPAFLDSSPRQLASLPRKLASLTRRNAWPGQPLIANLGGSPCLASPARLAALLVDSPCLARITCRFLCQFRYALL